MTYGCCARTPRPGKSTWRGRATHPRQASARHRGGRGGESLACCCGEERAQLETRMPWCLQAHCAHVGVGATWRSRQPVPPPLSHPAQTECVAQLAERPPYKELEGILRGVRWSMSSKPVGGSARVADVAPGWLWLCVHADQGAVLLRDRRCQWLPCSRASWGHAACGCNDDGR